MSVVHPLRLRSSNAYLVVGTRPILVDTGSPGNAARIVAACAGAGVRIRDRALILHTHVHSDHFGSTAVLAAEAGCPVAYHPGVDGILGVTTGRLFVGHGGPLLHADVRRWRESAARRGPRHGRRDAGARGA